MRGNKILLFFIMFMVLSCVVFNNTYVPDINPCLHMDNEYSKIECYQWRNKYPKEYNRFYERMKKANEQGLNSDSLFITLPKPINVVKK